MKFNITKLFVFCSCFIFLTNFYYCFADDMENEIDNFNTLESSSSDILNLNLNSRSCIVLDRVSQKVLFEKNAYNKLKMASTTKIMTAIIIIENCDLNKIVQISKNAAATTGSRLGLNSEDKISIKDLLYGLMLCSGNDAAVALAEECSNNVKDFSLLMNKKSKELGLNNTNFESPHGLDSDNHYTTAYELALLSDYALKNPVFFDIVGTKNYTVTINGYPKNISNTNELLGYLSGVYGIKTGFTNGANRCLVTACKRNNMDIICIVLGCDTKKSRTKDSIKLIEYTFKNFEYINIKEKIADEFNLWKQNNINNFKLNKGVSSTIELKYSDIKTDLIPINKDNLSSLKINIIINQNLNAPIYENNVIGKIHILEKDNCILSLDVLASNSILKKNFMNYFFEILKNYSFTLNSTSNIL